MSTPKTPQNDLSLDAADSSRLVPPRFSGKLVPREGLLARLQEARRRRCVAIRGPAGYGKTTAVVAWRQQLLLLGFDVAWLSLDEDDNRLRPFLADLMASLGQVAPGIVSEASQLDGYNTDPDTVERLVITLVMGIAQHPRELVLVLDDLHLLSDVGIHQALQWLLEYAPDNLHLVLTSRSSLPLSLGRLRSQEQVLELALDDLRFSAAETRQFLLGKLGEIDDQEIQRIHAMTDGWVAGLQVAAASRKRRRRDRPGPPPSEAQLRDNQAFTELFEAEVLSQLEPAEQELLLHMALCERVCAELCAVLVDRPQAVTEAAAVLERLASENLFVMAVDSDDGEAWFRLHPLFRETLLRMFGKRADGVRQQAHARAGGWFVRRERLNEAVRHLVQAGTTERAADLVEERIEALYAQGDSRLLIDLVRQLPAAQIDARPKLRLLQARMQVQVRDFAGALENLERLEREIPESDLHNRFRLSVFRAALAVQRDDLDSAVGLMPALLAPPPSASAIMLGGSLNALSWLYMHRGEYERARRTQIDRPLLLVNGAPLVGTPGGSLQGRCLIGLSLAMEGQMTQAERIYREVIYEAQRHGRSCTDALHLATALLGEVLYEANDVDAAYDLLVERVDIIERVSIPDSVFRALVVLAKCQWLRGNRQEAFAYLERLEEYGREFGLERLQAYGLLWQVLWNLELKERVAAESQLARLHALDASHVDSGPSPQREIHILAQSAQVRLEAYQGDIAGAAQRLEQVTELCRSTNRQLGVIRMTMLGALFDASLGRQEAARDKTLTALREAQRHGQLRSLLDVHQRVPALIADTAENRPLDPVLSFYVKRLRETRSPEPTLEAKPPRTMVERWQEASSRGPLSQRELDVVRLLAQAMTNKKIARALGLTHETVKWHLRHIYSKLGVSSRDEAVARLRDIES